jgi:hypothetical protein
MTFLGSINDAAAVFDATCDADMIENSTALGSFQKRETPEPHHDSMS